jgi:protein-S-isoprenylcysteine O-methyltransferase Ste14
VISTVDVAVVAICLLLFIIVNLHNLLQYHAGFSSTLKNDEVEKSITIPLLFATFGTAVFFFESFLYIYLGLSNTSFPLASGTSATNLKLFSLLVMIAGYAIFIWSVLARGRYATTWQMPADHALVHWGPYRYVRHPSYLGYFLMFTSFFLLSQSILAMIPLTAIPGYLVITQREEEMLISKFGERYLQYQESVGRFLPKLSLRKSRRQYI